MSRVFVDTSYYVALVSPRDSLNPSAKKLGGEFRGTQVTSEYVLVEVANFLSRAAERKVFVDLLHELAADTDTLILDASHERFRRGFDRFAERSDKEWSLTFRALLK